MIPSHEHPDEDKLLPQKCVVLIIGFYFIKDKKYVYHRNAYFLSAFACQFNRNTFKKM